MSLPVSNSRAMLIISGVALAVIAVAVISQRSSEQAPVAANTVPAAGAKAIANQRPAPKSLEEDKAQVTARLAEIQAMTDAQWPEDKKTHPNHAPTRQQAIANHQRRLARLNSITAEQWLANHQPKKR